MPRRKPQPSNHGKRLKRRAGLHKASTSPETLRWNAEHLIPERPPWLSADLYKQLAELRNSL